MSNKKRAATASLHKQGLKIEKIRREVDRFSQLIEDEIAKQEINKDTIKTCYLRLSSLAKMYGKLRENFLIPGESFLMDEINDLIISCERILYPELYPEPDSELE